LGQNLPPALQKKVEGISPETRRAIHGHMPGADPPGIACIAKETDSADK
jgi:hypothetical protein